MYLNSQAKEMTKERKHVVSVGEHRRTNFNMQKLLNFILGDFISGFIRNATKSQCYGTQAIIVCDSGEISIDSVTYIRDCIRCDRNCVGDQKTKHQVCNINDRWDQHVYFSQYSGKESGSLYTQRVRCIEDRGTFYTNQVEVKYQCMDSDTIVPFCEVYAERTDDVVHLQYKGRKFNNKDCYCSVSSTASSIDIRAVDVRLQRKTYTSGECGIRDKSFLLITDQSNNETFGCESKKMLGSYRDMYNSSEHNLDIHLHVEGEPQMVWIAVSANNGENVSVKCMNDKSTSLPSLSTTFTSEQVETTTVPSLSTAFTMEHVETTTGSFISTRTTKGNYKNNTTAMYPDSTTSQTSTQQPETTDSTNFISIQQTHSATESNTVVTTKTPNNDSEIRTVKTQTQTTPRTTITIYGSDTADGDRKVDPAIIALVIAGILTLLVIIIGTVFGIMKRQRRKFQRRQDEHFHNNLTLKTEYNIRKNKGNVYTYCNPEHDNPLAQADSLDGESLSVGDTNCTNVETTDESSNIYNKATHKLNPVLSSDINGHIYDKTANIPSEPTFISQYDTVEGSSRGPCSISSTNHLSRELLSGKDNDPTLDNPYVDEDVRQGMAAEQNYKNKRSSTLDFENNCDETMKDLVEQASEWASKDQK